jgi:hypothetical protein
MSQHTTLKPGDWKDFGTNLIGSTTLFARCASAGDSVLTYKLVWINATPTSVTLQAGQPWSTQLGAAAKLLNVTNDGFNDIEVWTDA